MERLGTFKLSKVEDVGIELNQGDVKRSKKMSEKSLVGRIYGGKEVNFIGLKQTMTKLWCGERSLKVIELKHKMYQFVFSRKEEKNRVLVRRPWTLIINYFSFNHGSQTLSGIEYHFHQLIYGFNCGITMSMDFY